MLNLIDATRTFFGLGALLLVLVFLHAVVRAVLRHGANGRTVVRIRWLGLVVQHDPAQDRMRTPDQSDRASDNRLNEAGAYLTPPEAVR